MHHYEGFVGYPIYGPYPPYQEGFNPYSPPYPYPYYPVNYGFYGGNSGVVNNGNVPGRGRNRPKIEGSAKLSR